MTKKTLLLVSLGTLLLCCTQSFATTNTTLTISDGLGDSLSVSANGAAICTGACNAGTTFGTGNHNLIFVSGATVGVFTINSLTTEGWGMLASPGLENTLNTDTSATGFGTLTISYTDFGFTGLTHNIQLAGSESTPNSNKTSVTYRAFGDPGNAVPATTLIGSLATLTGPSDNDTEIFDNPIGSSGSLTEQISLAFNGPSGGSMNTTFGLSNTPEPAGIILMGTVLLGVIKVIRKKRV